MKPRTLAIAVIAVMAITVAGTIWELTALRVFTKRAGELRGMIANPRPYDYVNYDYTPNGHYYELWAFKVPMYGTSVLLLFAGVTATVILMRAKLRRLAFVLWGVIVLCGVVFFTITFYYYVIAVNVFI